MKGITCLFLALLIVCIKAAPSEETAKIEGVQNVIQGLIKNHEQSFLEKIVRSKREAPGNDTNCNGNGTNSLVEICAKIDIGIDLDSSLCICKHDKNCQGNLLKILIKVIIKLLSLPDDQKDLVDICLLLKLNSLLNLQGSGDISVAVKLILELALKVILKIKVNVPLL